MYFETDSFELMFHSEKESFDYSQHNKHYHQKDRQSFQYDKFSHNQDNIRTNRMQKSTDYGLFSSISFELDKLEPLSSKFMLSLPVIHQNSDSEVKIGKFRGPRKAINFAQDLLFRTYDTYKGSSRQTKNFTPHLKTITKNYLSILMNIHFFGPEDIQEINKFCLSKASMKTFKILFKSKTIRLKCRSFYESKFFIHNIYKSKMQLSEKLTLIKYLEKIRRITYDSQITSWKDMD